MKLNLTPGGASLTFRFNDVKVPAAMFAFHLDGSGASRGGFGSSHPKHETV